ncbi:cytochrome P450 [Sphaerisporangium corydalis]|uniref:Cytochrome P450 n=1 Tax=Sphaerisporangium corydalis TaxID=1441875 RepID=A0ABV9EA27_9ACTN|nr:cytochrome P450 [Sphaerisporangium corydalis]
MAPTSVFDQILDHANRADPYPLYAELRKTPVARHADGFYVVSTYREIVALLHDPRVSSDRVEELSGGHKTGGDGGPSVRPSFINLDPPEHDRLRRVAMRHFGPPCAPGRLDRMRDEVAEIAASLVDAFDGRTRADIVEDFAYPLPVTVICRLLGVPREDEPLFRGWATALVETIDPRARANPAELERQRAVVQTELGGYLNELAGRCLRRPGDDLMSALVTDDGAEGRMSREELLGTASLLLVAGHETTVNLLANGVLTLLRHPATLDRLRREPGLIVPLVEELLRYEPPVHMALRRRALADIEIAGTTIPEGASISLVLAAGDRDPDRFPDPDRFDPERRDNEHLAFAGGIHYCFGAPMARLEAQVALPELARRLRNPRLVADPPPYRPNPLLRGPEHLLVTFDGVAPRAEPATRDPR